jgi:hypothetical protein
MRKLIIAIAVAAAPVAAQQQPPIRQITKLDATLADSVGLASVQTVLALPGGRVMLNDAIGRRAILLDSSLSRVTVVADTNAATAQAYGRGGATLMRFRGDSALLLVPSSLSMFVISPTGTIARTMAVPRPSDRSQPNDVWVEPGVDANGRLVYLDAIGVLPGMTTIALGAQLYENGTPTAATLYMEKMLRPTDSTALVRVDLETRAVDTITWISIPKLRRGYRADANGRASAVESTPDPLPILDWATMLRDGTLAIVRGADFHVDWIDPAGRATSSPKVPFAWQKADDARKQRAIDSTVHKWQSLYDAMAAQRSGATRGERGGVSLAPQVVRPASLADLPDYVPPFGEHAVDSDADGNVWIRTTTMVDGRPVYDVVNRRGELIDRLQLPAFRTIAGFGPGVIYMAVQTQDGKVHLERARIH